MTARSPARSALNRARRTFTVSWYLLKASRAHLVIGVSLAVLGALWLSLFATLSAGQPVTRYKPLPLTKRQAEELLSASMIAYLLLSSLLEVTRGAVLIEREAEREILLTCPISTLEYFTAKSINGTLMIFFHCFFWAGMAFVSNGGNLPKALYLLPILTATVFLFYLLSTILSALLLSVDARKFLVAVLIYLGSSALHSLALMAPSPLITLPFLPVARPVVHCFTITEPLDQVVLESLPIYFSIIPLFILHAKIANRVHPENLKLFAEVSAESRERGVAKPLYGKPSEVVYELTLWRPLLSRGHVLAVFIGSVASILLGHLLRALPQAGRFLESALPFMGVLPGFLFPFVSNLTLAVVMLYLAPLWVYRVYGGGFRALVNALMLRLTIYMLELATCVALFLSTFTGRLEYLLLPLAAAPAASGSAAATLLAVALIIPKKKLVKHAEGLTRAEEMVFFFVFGGAALFVIPLLIFTLLIQMGTQWLVPYVAVALALAALVHYLSVEIISELLRTRDVAT